MTALGPAYLTPTWRYAGDDWAGSNALTYTVYSVAPVYADDGVTIVTPGTPMDLTGFTASGTVSYRPQPVVANGFYGETSPDRPLPGVIGAIVVASAGMISLSLTRDVTIVPRQNVADWYVSPDRSKLLARPMVVDPSGKLVTVGLQPLFVF